MKFYFIFILKCGVHYFFFFIILVKIEAYPWNFKYRVLVYLIRVLQVVWVTNYVTQCIKNLVSHYKFPCIVQFISHEPLLSLKTSFEIELGPLDFNIMRTVELGSPSQGSLIRLYHNRVSVTLLDLWVGQILSRQSYWTLTQ